MDPISIATAVVALLAPFLGRVADAAGDQVAQGLGDAVTSRLGKLYSAVKERFAADQLASQSLDGLAEAPQDEKRQGALQFALANAIAADPDFGKTLETLVREAHDSNREVRQIMGNAGVVVQGGQLKAVNVVGGNQRIDTQVINQGRD